MTVRAQDVGEGTEIEVLWCLEEERVWWPARVTAVEASHDGPTSSVEATIVYQASHGHPETRSKVLIRDAMLIEEGVELRWRRLRPPGSADDDEGEQEDGGIIDDPTRSAMEVVQTGLACAMMDRPIEEQRVLAERLSRALERLQGEMRTVLEEMAPGEEVDNTIAETIVNRLGASL